MGSGCWPNYARILVEDVSHWFVFFFVFYIGGVSFAMMRIVAALFLKETMRVAEHSDREKALQGIAKTFQSTRRLAEAIAEKAGGADLTFAEMLQALSQPVAAECLSSMDLAKH